MNVKFSFMDFIRTADQAINQLISGLTADFSISSLILLILLSFVYGLAHSAGPGHGKSLVAAFFMKEKHPVRRSILLSLTISVIHTGAAVILSFLLYYVLTGIRGMFRIKLQSYFMTASGLLILTLGIVFLFLKLREHFHKGEDDPLHTASQGEIHTIILTGISAGIVPCPASLMIMLFTLSNNIVYIGLISVISISLGMFVLLSGIGVVAIYSRSAFVTVSSRFKQNTAAAAAVIEYISILLIVSIGFMMSAGFFKNLFV